MTKQPSYADETHWRYLIKLGLRETMQIASGRSNTKIIDHRYNIEIWCENEFIFFVHKWGDKLK